MTWGLWGIGVPGPGERTAGANGDLPEGMIITRKDYPRYGESSWHAHHNGQEIGTLYVMPSDYSDKGAVGDINVHDDYLRRGVASALWEAAGRPLHTPGQQTGKGQAWAQAVGGDNDFDVAWNPDDDSYDFSDHDEDEDYDDGNSPFYTSAHRTAMPNGFSRVWYHASPHDLKPGTELTPGGGNSPFANASYRDDHTFQNRTRYVWVARGLDDAHGWRDTMEEDGSPPVHIYEVVPTEKPEFWDKDTGYSTTGAKVLRKVFDAHTGEVKQAHRTAMPTLYRGMGLSFSNDYDRERNEYEKFRDLWREHRHDPSSLQIGDALTEYLDGQHRWPGTSWGRHWTTDRDVAENFAHCNGGMCNTVATAEWDGQGEDETGFGRGGDYPHEQEITLHPGTGLYLTNFELALDDGNWSSILRAPRHIKAHRTAARTASGGQQLHRGLHLRMDDFGLDQNDPDLAHKLLPALPTGVGRHWSREPEVAKSYAQGTLDRDQETDYFHPDHSMAVVLHGDWDGQGQDTDYESGLSGNDPDEWPHDHETTLSPDSRVRVHSISLMHPDHWGKWKTFSVAPRVHTARRTAMPTWYHLTDDPDFKLDPDVVPKNLNDKDLGAGVFLTKRPEEWAYDQHVGLDDHWSGDRPYVAEIDAPHSVHRLPGAWYDPDSTRPGEAPGSEETFVPADQYHHLQVINVRPRRKARTMTAAVTVYTQPNCIQCTMTKKQLDKLGIAHDTVDVSSDPEAHAYVRGLGYTAAPVVVVNDGEDHWAGFKPDRLKELRGE